MGLTCSASSQTAAVNTPQQLSCTVPYLSYACGDPQPSEPVYIFMMAVHGKNWLSGRDHSMEALPSRNRPAILHMHHYYQHFTLYIVCTSSDTKMQLPTETTVSDFHLTTREACYWLENSRLMYTAHTSLQINSLFSHRHSNCIGRTQPWHCTSPARSRPC